MVNNLLVSVANFIAALAQQIASQAGSILNTVAGWLGGLFNQIFNHLNSLIVGIYNWFSSAFNAIVSWIGQLINNLHNTFAFIMGKIHDMINFAMAGVANIVNNTVAKIQAFVNSVVQTIQSWIQQVINYIKGLVDAAVGAVKSIVFEVVNTVKGWIVSALNSIVATYNQIVNAVNQAIQKILGSAGSLIETVAQRLGDLRGAFADAAADIMKAMSNAPEAYTKAQTKMLEKILDPILDVMPATKMQEATQQMRALATGQVGLPAYRETISKGIVMMSQANPTLAAVFILMTLYSAVWAANEKLADVYTKPIIQEIAAQAPYEILSPIDIAAAWRRGYVDEGRAVEVIRRQGYTPQDAQVILRLADTVPAEFDLIAMELRGILAPQQVTEAFRVRGYSPEWADRVRRLAQVLPPVSDLIVMAVREVFSPDVAARFGQFEDFPQEFEREAAKQGLSAEWARRYWAAHWGLPSPMQGFEMFQRRIIDKNDLILLLRSLDIMPFWREKLIQLSYNPLTRVDVRRMHQMGVLSDQDVYNNYLDIGYSPQNAALLQDFTIKLNKGQQPVDDEELGRLTRTTVLNFYADGLITQAKAMEFLVGMGITPDAATLYVRSVDMNEQLAIRKEDANFIVEQAQAGLLTFEEAQDQLNNMGLEPIEVQRSVNKLVRLLASKTKLPTKAEAERMWEKGIISEDTYRDVLARLGYASHWVEAFVRLAKE